MESNTSKVDPYAVASELGLEVKHQPLPLGYHGLYTGSCIILLPGMTQREERSTLAHELGHHHYGHTHVHRSFEPKLEAACDLYAAEMLIDEVALLKLAHLYPDDPATIAYELNVSSWVLEAWAREHPLTADMDVAA